MQVDSVGSQSDAAASLPVPATPAQVPGIVAVVGDPLQFGGQPNGGQVLIPGFQNAAAQPNGVVPFISQPGGGGPSAAEHHPTPARPPLPPHLQTMTDVACLPLLLHCLHTFRQ